MITDISAAASLAASSWEVMAQEAAAYEAILREDHSRALEELLAAEMQDFHTPGVDAGVRLMVAKVALARVERRMGR